MYVKPGFILVGFVAIAAAVGIGVSALQRPPHHAPAVSLPPTGPTPVPHEPSVAFEFSAADDPSTGDVVLFGGVYDFDNTWLWNGSTWSLAHPSRSPSGRYGGAAAFDPQSDQILLFGGRLEAGTPTNDTWAWDGRTWLEVNGGGAEAPRPGDGSQMAWDAARNTMLLVTPPTGPNGGAQTWIWTGARWQRQLGGDLGSSFHNVLLAYDPVSRSVVAEGCCQVLPTQLAGGDSSTWRWDGTRWLVVDPRSPGGGSAMALDPVRSQLVLCDCNLVGGVVPSLYVWSGKDWAPLPSGSVPSQPQAEIDDVSRSQFLILGFAIGVGESIAQPLDVWQFNETSWRQLDGKAGSG
ncbi:MAG: kelch repeat-containing protein [Candidatus Dormiibacterota bacterium]